MVKRTYQPKKLSRIRKMGFRERMKSRTGQDILKRRRQKGRKILSVSDEMRIKGKAPRAKKR